MAHTAERYDGNPEISRFPVAMLAVSLLLALQLAPAVFSLLAM